MPSFYSNSGRTENAFLSPLRYLGDFTTAAVGEGPIQPADDLAELFRHAGSMSQAIALQAVTAMAEKHNECAPKAGLVH